MTTIKINLGVLTVVSGTQVVQPAAAMPQPIAFPTGTGGTAYAYVVPASFLPGAQGLAQPLATSQPMLPTLSTDPNTAAAQIQYIAYDPNQQYAGYTYIAPQMFPTPTTTAPTPTPTPTSTTTTTTTATTNPSTTSTAMTQQTNRYTPY